MAGTVVGTNLITAIPPGASPITVTFNYNGATGGNTLASDTVTPGASADSVLPFPTKSGLDFSGWFNPQSLLKGQRITTIGEADAGQLQAGYVPGELAQNLNLLLPQPPQTCAYGYAAACSLGATGPGGGLVFLISGGKAYEMAPKAWSLSSGVDASAVWITNATNCYAAGLSTGNQNCQTNNLYPGTSDAQTASSVASRTIGMGSANTAAIKARMFGVDATLYAAGLASAYTGGGFTDWFLPSKDELNAMYGYKNSIVDTAKFGFASDGYWSSSQISAAGAWTQYLGGSGEHGGDPKINAARIRPVRAF